MSDGLNGGTLDSKAAIPQVQTVAYYRDSLRATSIPIQRDQVREWADKNGLKIACEFSDGGQVQPDAQG